MNKIFLIIQREYLVRVQKKSFLIVTFIVPVLIATMYGFVFYLVFNQNQLGAAKKIWVIDESGLFKNDLKSSDKLTYTSPPTANIEKAKNDFKKSGVDFILYIPHEKSIPENTPVKKLGEAPLSRGVQLIGEKEPSIKDLNNIQEELEKIMKVRSYLDAGIDTAKVNHLQTGITIQSSILTDQGEKKSNSFSSFIIGIVSSILIYMFILLYGVQVMRGVMEEKTSRVIEILISSVRPFQLMMGKIIGIALVGLTQFILWIVLTTTVIPLISSQFSSNSSNEASNQAIHTIQSKSSIQSKYPKPSAKGMENAENSGGKNTFKEVFEMLETQNYPLLIGCFIYYFLSGYLLYSALFAAIGAAVDSETETQQFMFPITIPLVFAIIISSNYVVSNPDSSLSVWLSMIPFFSPIVMMVRITFHPPLWQILLSMFLMIPGFLGTVWLAGKIYKTGILMYGQKINFGEIRKWLFYKN